MVFQTDLKQTRNTNWCDFKAHILRYLVSVCTFHLLDKVHVVFGRFYSDFFAIFDNKSHKPDPCTKAGVLCQTIFTNNIIFGLAERCKIALKRRRVLK